MLIRTFTILLFLTFALSLLGQNDSSRKEILEQYRVLRINQPSVGPGDFLSRHRIEMGMSDHDNWILVSEEKGKNNYMHYKYKQEHKGIPIYATSYVLHAHNGKVVSANGSFLPKIKLETVATLSVEEATAIARKELGFPEDADPDLKAGPLQAEDSEAELVIMDKKMPSYSGSYALAYMLDINDPAGCERPDRNEHKSCSHNLNSKRYFIDAHSGNVLQEISLIEEQGVPAQCNTLYYGEQTLTIDSLGATSYELRDPTRGMDGIAVTDDAEVTYTSDDKIFDGNDAGFENGAVDALYSTVSYYDMMVEHFNWTGLDNEDRSLEIGVYAFGREEYVNAFWNGRKVWIGNGDCSFGPLATVTVVGHEFTHGIIDNTSDLVYSSEPGGINESIADVIGKALEYQLYPDDFTWGVGTKFSPEVWEPFRIMDDPLVKEHPAFYKGVSWIEDNDVHINSSIGNLWYVLLSDGKTGVNERGEAYSVAEMGNLSAAQFIFHINRHYLVENSSYNDYYDASLLALEELFPGDDDLVANVKEAWKAVGLPNYPNLEEDFVDLGIETQGLYQLCGFGSYLSAYVDIENLGSLDYEPQMNGRLVITNGANETLRELPLSENLSVDEKVRIELDSILEIEEYFSRINVKLELDNDIIPENNTDRTFALTTEFANDNVSISMIFAKHVCFSEQQEVTIIIRNESCETLMEGTAFDVIIQNDNGDKVLEESYVLERNLNRGAAIDLARTISIPREVDDSYEITLDSDMITDPDFSDNVTTYDLPAFQEVLVDYDNSFSQEDDLAGELLVASGFQPSALLEDFMGNSAFHVSGNSGRDEQLMCPEVIDNFTGDGINPFENIKAIIRLCADLTGEITPSLHFDLAQSRNDENLYPSEASSALLLKWVDDNSGESGELVVSGQPENTLVRHDVALPDDFKGGLAFSFVAINEGVGDETDELYFDNLNFGMSVSTTTVDENHLEVFPNPTGSELNLITDGVIQSTRVLDVHGRVVLQGKRPKMDVTALESGTYLLRVLLSDGLSYDRRFVKL